MATHSSRSRSADRPNPGAGEQGFRVKSELEEIEPTPLRDLGENYVNAFVTFIDILGFGNLVACLDSSRVNGRLDAMQIFNSAPQRRRGELQDRALLPMVCQLSDSIIRIQPVAPSDAAPKTQILDFYIGELESLLIAQGNLACNGIFIRGGMTYGEVCVHKSRIFGPAFIRAYKLESQFAQFPRIVVDQRLCKEIDNPLISIVGKHDWVEFREYAFELLEQDSDGQWFVQYLSHLYDSHHPDNVDSIDVLRAHRDKVQEQLKQAQSSGSEDIACKYFWVANYHNRLIDRSFSRIDERLHKESGESLFVELE